ncbi:MAG TPA: DNA-binding protein [Roseiflexaceae bacterium]|nr:DNA-binding protein [Roseiflexaceae bacterium]
MAARIVTQEAVDRAADELVAAGQVPTLTVVQERTGGSYTTVKRHLEVWQARRKAAPPVVEPPAEVLSEAQRLASLLWQVAAAQADQRVAEIQAEAERAVEEARVGQREAEAAIARLERELEDAAEAQAAAERLTGELRGLVEGAQRSVETAQARAGELEQRVGEQARQLEQQAEELREARAQLLEQARQLGELEALRRQVEQQQGLIATLSQGRPRGQRPQGGDHE